MTALKLFTTPFVMYLRDAIPQNIDGYLSGDLTRMFSGYTGTKEIDTKIEWDDGCELRTPQGDITYDLLNAIEIHRHLGALTPAQATDQRLWTRLSHIEFRKYMQQRFPLERYADSTEKATRFVRRRYFLADSQARSLMRNGISRLWWAAHLTVDHEREDPYELTAVLLAKLDIAKNLLERSMGRSRSVLVGFLDFLNENADTLLAPGDAARENIRQLSRFVNLAGGTAMLDALSSEHISDMLSRYYESMVENDAQPTLAGPLG